MKRIRTTNSLVHGLWVETSQIPALHPLPDKRETTHAQDCSLGSSMLCTETGIFNQFCRPRCVLGPCLHTGRALGSSRTLKLARPSSSARLWCPHRILTGATSMVLFTSTMPRTSWWGETASPIPWAHFLLKSSANHSCSAQWLFTNCKVLLARWHSDTLSISFWVLLSLSLPFLVSTL